jgi:hypothetical protein
MKHGAPGPIDRPETENGTGAGSEAAEGWRVPVGGTWFIITI